MKYLPMVFILLITLSSCQTTSRVSRIDSNVETDLSGRWNDTDSRLVSSSMIDQLINNPVLNDFSLEKSRKPVLIIGSVRNSSSEHINVLSFIKDLERDLVNSGKVRLVASNLERGELRSEKEDQQSNASFDSAKRLAQETGADIMLIGNILSISDQLKNTRIVYYQIDLELIDLETNEKLWIGSYKHKKVIELGGTKW